MEMNKNSLVNQAAPVQLPLNQATMAYQAMKI